MPSLQQNRRKDPSKTCNFLLAVTLGTGMLGGVGVVEASQASTPAAVLASSGSTSDTAPAASSLKLLAKTAASSATSTLTAATSLTTVGTSNASVVAVSSTTSSAASSTHTASKASVRVPTLQPKPAEETGMVFWKAQRLPDDYKWIGAATTVAKPLATSPAAKAASQTVVVAKSVAKPTALPIAAAPKAEAALKAQSVSRTAVVTPVPAAKVSALVVAPSASNTTLALANSLSVASTSAVAAGIAVSASQVVSASLQTQSVAAPEEKKTKEPATLEALPTPPVEAEGMKVAGPVMLASAHQTAPQAQEKAVEVKTAEKKVAAFNHAEKKKAGKGAKKKDVPVVQPAPLKETQPLKQAALVPLSTAASASPSVPSADVEVISEQAKQAHSMEPVGGYMPLNKVRIAINMEQASIEDIIDRVVSLAADKTGPWDVKWRLSKENDFVKNERVNVTAEGTFDDFMNNLVDRINNMAGVYLFVTVFESSRIILISDTYY